MNVRTRVKICGVTVPEEAFLAIDAGADALGFIAADSPRRVSLEHAYAIVRALPVFITPVAVLADPSFEQAEEAVRMGCLPQFCGDESPTFCESVARGAYVKVFRVAADANVEEIARYADRYPRATISFDAHVAGKLGGTGVAFDWDLVRALAARRRVIVSGGLTPENVGDCVRRVRPYAVDVRSGVETNGKKDPERIAAFVRAVREADAQA